MAKKKKREAAKRRSKGREKRKKKRTLRLAKSTSNPKSQTMYRPGLSDLGAPEGFRSISMAQAMMEYAKPLMELIEGGDGDIEDATQAAMVLWNYALSIEKGHRDQKIEGEILESLKGCFSLGHSEAEALFTRMMERRNYLFPPDKQPRDRQLPFMFIRKEVRHIIKAFDYGTLDLSDDIIPPDKKDKVLVDRINKLETQISAGVDYGQYEGDFFALKDESQARFEKWLVKKGLTQNTTSFSDCLHIYLDFIYGYVHDDTIVLKSVPPEYFVEFFEDFLLRKMMVEPYEYVYWPPALKLFYRFLHEKGYLDNPEQSVNEIDRVEPHFIKVLKKQFS